MTQQIWEMFLSVFPCVLFLASYFFLLSFCVSDDTNITSVPIVPEVPKILLTIFFSFFLNDIFFLCCLDLIISLVYFLLH